MMNVIGAVAALAPALHDLIHSHGDSSRAKGRRRPKELLKPSEKQSFSSAHSINKNMLQLMPLHMACHFTKSGPRAAFTPAPG
jgi:hypothetical protein